METYIISKSTNPIKKYDVLKISMMKPIKKIASFGATGYSDYTKHKDEERKENYISRHSIREDWDDLNTAGTWARFILWNEKTINKSIKDMEKRFNIKIILLK
jgi:hypothetical protein